MQIVYPESAEKYIGLQCNGDKSLYEEMPDTMLAEDVLSAIMPEKVIDIGAGIGRASVYFQAKYGWNCEYNYIDGDGGEKQLAGIRDVKDGEYYNSWAVAQEFSEANGIKKLKLWNPEEDGWRKLRDCDLAYSFLAVGFHWPIEMYLDRIHKCMRKGGKLIFGMRGLENLAWVYGQIKRIDTKMYDILFFGVYPKKAKSSTLILEAR
jgi:SAM-dependent methyltransferase